MTIKIIKPTQNPIFLALNEFILNSKYSFDDNMLNLPINNND